MLHQVIESLKARIALRPRYDNYIGGKWVAPAEGRYFDNISPITGRPICQIARSQAADVELALDAAHAAKDKWAATAPAQRAAVLYKIAGRGRDHRQRQADPRDARRRHSARCRPFSLFRGVPPGAGRFAVGEKALGFF
jgi:hypothetical protein